MSTTGTVDDPAPPPRRSVAQVVLRAPRPVWILVIGMLVNRSGSYFSTFLALYLAQIGFDLQEMPVILLVVGVATPMGAMIGGTLGDRFSRKAALSATTLMAAVGLAIMGAAPTREVALVGVFVASLFAQSYLPAASALLVDHTAEQDRVPTFAFFRLALNLGAAIGPVLAIAIMPFGLNKLFLVSSACYLAFAGVMVVGLPRARRRHGGTDEPEPAAVAAPGTRSPASLAACLAAVLGITLVYVQYSSSVSLAVSQAHDASAYALLLILNGVLVIALELPLSSWTRRLPVWRPLLLGTALMAVGIPLSGAFTPLWVILGGVLIWTVGEILFAPVVASAVASLSPPDRIGRYQGYLGSVQAAGFALGPALGTFVYGARAGLLWGGCLVVGVLCCLGFVLAGRIAGRQRTAV